MQISETYSASRAYRLFHWSYCQNTVAGIRTQDIGMRMLYDLFQSVRDGVLFLLPGHAEVGDLDDVAVADQAVPGGQVPVNAVLHFKVLHSG